MAENSMTPEEQVRLRAGLAANRLREAFTYAKEHGSYKHGWYSTMRPWDIEAVIEYVIGPEVVEEEPEPEPQTYTMTLHDTETDEIIGERTITEEEYFTMFGHPLPLDRVHHGPPPPSKPAYPTRLGETQHLPEFGGHA